MDIHQAAKAVVNQIDETGQLPDLGVCGLCYLFTRVMGVEAGYKQMACFNEPSYSPIGESGQWTETRMTLLALLAETCAEEFENPL